MANPVQVGEIHGAAGGTFTFGAAVSAGNRIIVGIFCHNQAPTAPTCSGCTFFKNGSTQTDAGGNTYTVWSGVPSASFSGAITINGTGAQFFSAQFSEAVTDSTTGSTSAGVRTSAGSFGSSTAVTSTATAAATAGDYLYGFMGQDGDETTTTATGTLAQNDNVTHTAVGTAYTTVEASNNNTTAAAQTASWTTNNAQRWGAIAIVYIAASAATASFPPQLQRSLDGSRIMPQYVLRRGTRRQPVPPQVNPPMPPTWWRRPFLPTNRFFIKRARISVPIRPQVNPPFSTTWWSRAFQVQARKFLRRGPFRYDLPIRAQVNPPLPPVWWRRHFVGFLRSIAPRRAKRFDVIRAQVNPPLPPIWWSRSFQVQLRKFARRARLWEPPWGQASATPNPAYASWPGRLRRVQGWLRRRVPAQVFEGATAIPGVRRRPIRPVLRRVRVFLRVQAEDRPAVRPTARRGLLIRLPRRPTTRPLTAVVVAAPLWVAQQRRRLRPVMVRMRKRIFLPPLAATVAPVAVVLQNFVDSIQSIASVIVDAVSSVFSSNAGSVSADSLQGSSQVDTTEGGPGINSEVEGR